MTEKVTRTYTVSFDLHKWLKRKAEAEKRPLVKQVEAMLEEAMKSDKKK